MILRRCILVPLLFLMVLSAWSQPQNQPYDSVENLMQQEGFMPEEIPDKNDPPPVTIRPMPAGAANDIRQQKEYGYMSYIDSVLRAKNAAALAERQKEKPRPIRIGWIRGLLWGIALAALLFVVYQVVVGRNILSRNKALNTPHQPADNKNDPQQLLSKIEAAIQRKEYRIATRLLFLDALQLMASHGYLHLMPEKTNHQYLNEIEDEGRKAAFAICLMHYEFTWYGEFQPNENQFRFIEQSFTTLRDRWI